MEQVRSFSILWLLQILSPIEGLLYPQGNLGLVSSVSVPVTEYFPERIFIIDWCFVMSFDLPGSVSSFYNIPVWPTQNFTKRAISDNDDMRYLALKYDAQLEQKKNRHHNDFSAGELYQAIEDQFISFGYHETCLLRIVCELAQHPFDDRHQNYLSEMATFILTPSLHEGFDVKEEVYRDAYLSAEQRGFLGENCTNLYAECEHNLLGFLSHVIFLND